ncbi:MAG: hypothetical protein SFZ24_07230 [Planctomycetota bacterium]|nr:hypothetical protein [Planctomycetota bacterium]
MVRAITHTRRTPVLVLAALACAAPALASDNELAALTTGNAQANASSTGGRVSPDGRFVLFVTGATNVAPGETNFADVWVRDRYLNTTAKISVPDPSMPQVLANSGSAVAHPGARVMSDDGRFVVFSSFASNLVSGDTNDVEDVFVRDRDLDQNGIFDEPGAGKTRTVRVSLTSTESQSFGSCPNQTCTHGAYSGTISADGRYVAFVSDFDFAGSEAFTNVYRRDRDADNDGVFDEAGGAPNAAITELVTPSISCANCDHNGYTDNPAISADGRHIAFESGSSRHVFSDFNNSIDIFVRDMQGDTYRVSQRADGGEGEPSANSFNPSISGTGRYVAFDSRNDDLDPADNQNLVDVFVYDRDADNDNTFDEPGQQAIERVSKGRSALPLPGGSINPLNDDSFAPSISDDGRYVAFQSNATNNSCGLFGCTDENGFLDVFVHDRDFDVTTLVPVSSNPFAAGAQGNGSSFSAAISADGRFVAYQSNATNLINGDQTGNSPDVFVRALRNDTNDTCSTIQSVVNIGVYFGDTYTAGNEGDATCGTSSDSPDSWFTYTAVCDGQVTFDTNGSSFDTVLSAHTACPGTTANIITCNDDINGAANRNSSITLFLTQGQTVIIRLSGFNLDSGFYQFNVSSCIPCCPGNANKNIPGNVDFSDITAVLQSFNAAYGAASGPGDANCDGSVNFSDITSVLQNFNTDCN